MTTLIAQMSSVEMLRTLVAYPTVSRDSNLALITFAREYLEDLGAECRLTFDDDKRKANLFATLWAASGDKDKAGILLSGHTDVVPVDGQHWSSDPFQLIERDGKFYGRGTADMKSFIACALVAAPAFAHRGLKVPLHFALSYDEEVGCLGIGRLIADGIAAGLRPQSCIVGEPTLMRPIIAHKGRKSFRCTVRGLSCHSAYAPRGVNAVEAAAEAVTYLKQMARRYRDRGPYDKGFDVAHTTVHVGVIRGGTVLNIVPNECVFDFEFRHLPGDAPEALLEEFRHHIATEIEPEMREIDPNSGFTIAPLSAMPVLNTHEQADIVALARDLSGEGQVGKVSFGTEAPHFQNAGIPAVVCGPGSIEQAHRPDEFVAREQIAKCDLFLQRLMDRVCQ